MWKGHCVERHTECNSCFEEEEEEEEGITWYTWGQEDHAVTSNGSRVQRTSWTSIWPCSIYQVASHPVQSSSISSSIDHPIAPPVGRHDAPTNQPTNCLSIHPFIHPSTQLLIHWCRSKHHLAFAIIVVIASSSVYSRYIEAFQNGLTMAFDRVTSSLSVHIHHNLFFFFSFFFLSNLLGLQRA